MSDTTTVVPQGVALPALRDCSNFKALCLGRPDKNPSNGDDVKTPVEERLKRSKFSALLATMSDEQLKATTVALLFDDKVKEAVKMWHTSRAHYVMLAALALHLESRGIPVTKGEK